MGTIGIFGKMKNTPANESVQTVALSSAHVISSGDIACSSTGVRFGKCIWPESGVNIHDVSIIKIDSSMIDQDRSQDLKLEGRQFYAGGLWVAFRSPLGPGQSPSGGSGG